MGSSASKSARTAGGAVRKYPSRIPPQTTTSRAVNVSPSGSTAGPNVHPQSQASGLRNAEITRDSSDPDLAFNARLAQLGSVQPSPTFSHSSTFNASARAPPLNLRSQSQAQAQAQPSPATSSFTFQPSASTPSQSIFPSPASNPAITLLTARSRIAKEAEEEFEGLGMRDSPGRSFLDVVTIRQVLMMRDELRKDEAEIERTLSLKKGVVGKLPKGVFTGAGA